MRHVFLLFLAALFFTLQSQAQTFNDEPAFAESVFARSLPNYHVVNQGLSRSARPTAQGLKQLRDQGFKTIVTLEMDQRIIAEEKRMVEALGMRFINMPMSWTDRPSDEKMKQLLTMMQTKSMLPMLIHCKHGQDRTGLVIGLYRVFVEGWKARKAYEEMLAIGFKEKLAALRNYYFEKTQGR